MRSVTNSIVIVGSMNPAIHHPAWYLRSGLISEGDAEHALGNDVVIATSEFSQFVTGKCAVACMRNRWDVRPTQSGSMVDARELCRRLFGELRHTPVTAVGFNFDEEFASPQWKLKAYVTSPIATARPAAITLKEAFNEGVLSTVMSEDEGRCAVRQNFNFAVTDVTQLLARLDALDAVQARAMERLELLGKASEK